MSGFTQFRFPQSQCPVGDGFAVTEDRIPVLSGPGSPYSGNGVVRSGVSRFPVDIVASHPVVFQLVRFPYFLSVYERQDVFGFHVESGEGVLLGKGNRITYFGSPVARIPGYGYCPVEIASSRVGLEFHVFSGYLTVQFHSVCTWSAEPVLERVDPVLLHADVQVLVVNHAVKLPYQVFRNCRLSFRWQCRRECEQQAGGQDCKKFSGLHKIGFRIRKYTKNI